MSGKHVPQQVVMLVEDDALDEAAVLDGVSKFAVDHLSDLLTANLQSFESLTNVEVDDKLHKAALGSTLNISLVY